MTKDEQNGAHDFDLIESYLAGDPQAAETLVRRYTGFLVYVLSGMGFRRQDIDDLLQDTWVSAFASCGGLIEKNAREQHSDIRGWLKLIAARKGLRLIRQNKRHSLLGELDDELPAREGDPEQILFLELIEQLKDTMHREDFELLSKQYIENVKPKKLANALMLPVVEIYRRTRRAKRRAIKILSRSTAASRANL